MGILGRDKSCSTMAVKCYEEQLTSGEEGLITAIKAISADDINIVAIKHDKSFEKAHWHILLRGGDRKKRMRVVSTLKRLSIVFREGQDDALWENHGVETVGDFSSYTTYLLHQTDDAKKACKEPYDKTDFVTNLSNDEIDRILAGYTVRKKKQTDTNSYNDMARDAGYNLRNYDEFVDSLGIINMPAAMENNIRNCYLSGVSKKAREHEYTRRFFVQIRLEDIKNADAYMYAAEKALSDKKTIARRIERDLSFAPDTEAMVSLLVRKEDDKQNALSVLADDYIGEFGTLRNKQIWAGDTFIVITDEVLERREKFFQCKVKKGVLNCTSAPQNLSSDDAAMLTKIYKAFKSRFDDAYSQYTKEHSGTPIDLADLNS